ncbi:transcription repressor OFP17 [Euphorbia lathyris]|uniref:transcription repressor OFP17 n=1 Tax=Euphorbia lathyris TaxID=212925 RepID=UPI0033141E67
MKLKALFAFKSKLLSKFRKLFLIFRFKLKKPLFIRPLRRRKRTRKSPKTSNSTAFHSVFGSRKLAKNMDRVKELKSSASEAEKDRRKPFSSPITPGYIRASRTVMKEAFGDEDVEDACRSFENYLVEMIVEEGKIKDLMDVEELLHCWKHLKCPVFIDMVCRFYGELCKDLFSPEEDDSLLIDNIIN